MKEGGREKRSPGVLAVDAKWGAIKPALHVGASRPRRMGRRRNSPPFIKRAVALRSPEDKGTEEKKKLKKINPVSEGNNKRKNFPLKSSGGK